jgi:hypothetical protein
MQQVEPRTMTRVLAPAVTKKSVNARLLLVVMVVTGVISLSVGVFAAPKQVSAATLVVNVSGNHLVDGIGAPIQLRGVNRSGTEYACVQYGGPFDGPSDQASVTAIKSWNVNAVRVPMNESCWLGISGAPCCALTQAAYQQAIINYVNLLNTNGIYVILELHWANYGTNIANYQAPMPNRDHSPAFWTSVATTFKDNHAVLFDLYNEPFGSCSWKEWRDGCIVTQGSPGSTWSYQSAGMQELVTAVRNTGATQPIMVGGLGYANMVAIPGTGPGQGPCCGWMAYKPVDPLNSIVLSVHTYNFNWPCPGTVGTTGAAAVTCYSSGDNNLSTIAAVHPVVFGEIGESTGTAAFITPLMNWMDTNGFSYLAWTWDTWGCGAGAVLISNYNGTPCQTFGSGFQAHLAAVAGITTPTVISVSPNSGPSGTSVVITGSNFTGATAVKFGATPATAFTVNSATQITATSPAGSGTVDVTVTTASGTSAVNSVDKFTYTGPPPTVTGLAPTTGPAVGGTSVTITGTNFTGASAVKFGATPATTFTINSATQITATSPAGTGTVDVTVTTPAGTSATSAADRFVYTLPPAAAYTAVTPVRLLDTRNVGGPLGPGGVRNLIVAGATPGSPSGATAVVLNVTVTNTTAAGFLTVYPAGSTRPVASSLNWAAGSIIPGLVTVQVGTGGAITFFNAGGSTDVVVDLEGYFAAPSGTAGGEVALTPARITDTRPGSGRPNAGRTLGSASTLTVQVTGAGGVPASGVSAAILNVTVTNTSAPGVLTVWPAGAARPLASNLNWVAGQTVPNRVFVPLGSGGQVSIFNFWGLADVVVDVSGYFTDASAAPGTGKQFTSVSPLRLIDTRLTGQTMGAGGKVTLQVSGLTGVPSGASAVILTVTVTNTNAPSFLTVYPSTVALPTASDLNWVGGMTVANLTVASLGSTGAITFFNAGGLSDVVVDLAGWFS